MAPKRRKPAKRAAAAKPKRRAKATEKAKLKAVSDPRESARRKKQKGPTTAPAQSRKLTPGSVLAKAKAKAKPAAKVKPAKPAAKPAPAPKKRAPANKRPTLPKARVYSRTSEAIRSRARRAEAKQAELDARERKNAQARKRRADARALAEAEAQRKAAQRKPRKPRKGKGAPPTRADERGLAIDWLEYMRNTAASLHPISLDVVDAELGATTPWLVVGRFDLLEPLGYQAIAEIFQLWADDLILEAMVNPQRLSQIRIVYVDPKDPRGASDSIVSSVGAWEFVISDLIGDLIGSGDDDEDALAVRYAATAVGTFFVYFAPTLIGYNVVGPWAARPAEIRKPSGPGGANPRTHTIKLR